MVRAVGGADLFIVDPLETEGVVAIEAAAAADVADGFLAVALDAAVLAVVAA